VINEPLAVLAAPQWVNQSNKFPMFKDLLHNIHNRAPRQNGFEAYLAFHVLQKAFGPAPAINMA
jgi:hypothetical protein